MIRSGLELQLGLALHNSIRKLPSKLRTAIVLKEIEGLSYEEIADIIEVFIVLREFRRSMPTLSDIVRQVSSGTYVKSR